MRSIPREGACVFSSPLAARVARSERDDIAKKVESNRGWCKGWMLVWIDAIDAGVDVGKLELNCDGWVESGSLAVVVDPGGRRSDLNRQRGQSATTRFKEGKFPEPE